MVQLYDNHSSKTNDLKQVDSSLYYKLLQTACRDFKKEISKTQESITKGKGKLSNIIKCKKRHKNQLPSHLYCKIVFNYYEEPWKPQQGMFFDSSKSRIGCQSLENQLDLIKEINQPLNNGLNDDAIRIL